MIFTRSNFFPKLSQILILFTATFGLFISPAVATGSTAQTYGPTDINELSKRYAKEASSLDIFDYNSYEIVVLKDYGDLGDLITQSKSFRLEKGMYRITSLAKEGPLGQEIKMAPEFIYLQIKPDYFSVSDSSKTAILKKFDAENYFYVEPDANYDIKLIDLRKTRPGYQELKDEFTSDDIKLVLEKIKIEPNGGSWFVDTDIKRLVSQEEFSNFVKNGGTVFEYAGQEQDIVIKNVEEGRLVYLDSDLKQLSSEELEYKLSKIGKTYDFGTFQQEIELAVTVILAVLTFLLIFVPFRLSFRKFRSIDTSTTFFRNISKGLGLQPINLLKFLFAILLVFAGIFYLLQLLPLTSIVSSDDSFLKEGDWYRFRNAADFLTFGVPNISQKIKTKGNFISDEPMYINSTSSARTFQKSVSLVRVPGIEFDELFELIPTSETKNYKTYINPKAPSVSDYVFDVETLNKRAFIKEEIVDGTEFDHIFNQVPTRFGIQDLKIKLEDFDEFGVFFTTVEASNLNASITVSLEPAGSTVKTGDQYVGGVVSVYSLDGTQITKANLISGDNKIYVNLPSGIYYLDIYTFGANLSVVQIHSESQKFAADWRLFGREREVFTARCGEKNEFIMVTQDWIADYTVVDSCAYDAWLKAENQLTTMFTADIYNVFVDTIILPTSDVVVTNRETALPPNENRSVLTLYNASLGKFSFEDKFSLRKIKFTYEKD